MEKKIINKKKKIQVKIKTCTTHVLQHTLKYIAEHYAVQLQSSKSIVGTLHQHLLDGFTFNQRIQCSLLEVL